MDAVLLTPACSDPFYRRAARVSMGTVFQIPWTYLPSGPSSATEQDNASAGSYIKQLQELGFITVAMALLGTEGEGLSQETLDACDHTVMIPMSHGVDSLNVAAASAVAFFEITKDL